MAMLARDRDAEFIGRLRVMMSEDQHMNYK